MKATWSWLKVASSSDRKLFDNFLRKEKLDSSWEGLDELLGVFLIRCRYPCNDPPKRWKDAVEKELAQGCKCIHTLWWLNLGAMIEVNPRCPIHKE